VIPGAVGGDVIKAAYLCRMQPDRKPQAVASMVLDRILGLLGLFLLAGIAGAASWRSADPQVNAPATLASRNSPSRPRIRSRTIDATACGFLSGCIRQRNAA
jgi:hypothetical protein